MAGDGEGCAWVIGVIAGIALIALLLGIAVYNLASIGYYVFYVADKMFYISRDIPLVWAYGIYGSLYGFLTGIIIVAKKNKLPDYISGISILLMVIITFFAILT